MPPPQNLKIGKEKKTSPPLPTPTLPNPPITSTPLPTPPLPFQINKCAKITLITTGGGESCVVYILTTDKHLEGPLFQ